MSNSISAAEIAAADPFARFCFARKQSAFLLSLWVFLIGLAYMFGASAWFGVLLPEGKLRASLADVFNQVNFLFIFPAAGYYFLWQFHGLARAYSAVLALLPAGRAEAVAAELRENHRRCPWWLAGFLVGLLGVGLGLVDNFGKLGLFWYSKNFFMIFGIQAARFFALYVIINAIVLHLVSSYNFNRLYRDITLIVSVADTPQTEAFAQISAYSLSFAALGAIAGLNLGLQPVLSTIFPLEYAIFCGLYFTLVPSGFFLPFIQARKKMVETKDSAMLVLNVKYQREYETLMDKIRAGAPAAEAEEVSTRIKAIEDAIALTEKAPSWPFEMLSVYRMGVTVILPFLIALINFIPVLKEVFLIK
ncbi:MAG: hypothetical protein OHK0031_07300 [Anaerolineales bacterium]